MRGWDFESMACRLRSIRTQSVNLWQSCYHIWKRLEEMWVTLCVTYWSNHVHVDASVCYKFEFIWSSDSDFTLSCVTLYMYVWFDPVSWAALVAQLVEHLPWTRVWVPPESANFSLKMTALDELHCIALWVSWSVNISCAWVSNDMFLQFRVKMQQIKANLEQPFKKMNKVSPTIMNFGPQ